MPPRAGAGVKLGGVMLRLDYHDLGWKTAGEPGKTARVGEHIGPHHCRISQKSIEHRAWVIAGGDDRDPLRRFFSPPQRAGYLCFNQFRTTAQVAKNSLRFLQ